VTIVEFLTQRIAEVEAVAKAATVGPWVAGVVRKGTPGHWAGIECEAVLADRTRNSIEESETVAKCDSMQDVAHIVRHDPARVLAECKAKRAIVELFAEAKSVYDTYLARQDYEGGHLNDLSIEVEALTPVMRALALPHADHRDFQESWRP
jgi:hypothetical protein